MSVEFRQLREEDKEQFLFLHAQAFNLPTTSFQRIGSYPLDEVRVLADGDRLVASLRLRPFGQFFGGRSLPGVGIAGVQVTPAARSRGYGRILMSETLADLRSQGVAVSTLYPSTPSLYRRTGYEFAGDHNTYRLPIATLPRFSEEGVEPWDDTAMDDVVESYTRFARGSSGLMDRPKSWWSEILTPRHNRLLYRYLVRRNGRVGGYLIYTQEREPRDRPYYYSLHCRDLYWNDNESARAILGFVAGTKALGVQFRWISCASEPLSTLIDSQEIEAESSHPWMIRIVNLAVALEQRGYSPAISAAVELSISDPVLPQNNKALRLQVNGGSGKVTWLDKAQSQVDIGILGSIYTGWLPARDAVRLGRLKGAGEEEVSTLESIFSGPRAWLGAEF